MLASATSPGANARPSGLHDYAQVLRRHKWLALAVILLVTAASVALSLQQAASYQATAEVLVNREDLSAVLSRTSDASSSQDPGRYANTQAELARVPAVTRQAITAAEEQIELDSFLANSRVVASPDSDILLFEVDHETAAGARDLVNEYAASFVAYRTRLDTQTLKRVQEDLAERLDRLSAAGGEGSRLYRDLASKQQELRVLEAVQTSHAVVVREASSATKTRPRPVRDGLLGLALGLILAAVLVFVVEALDTRLSGGVEIAETLGLPLLGRLAPPPRRLVGKLVMLREPRSVYAESFRLLRTNLELVNLERDARTIMVASALEDEGKSTTLANLAVAFARAGRRVALVDLDLRRGRLDRLFGVSAGPGVAAVALGATALSDALESIDLEPTRGEEHPGTLALLRAGEYPPNPGEMVAGTSVGDILSELSVRFDLVLVDAPPFLTVGDAMALSTRVDGVVVVVPVNVRRTMVGEMRRILGNFGGDTLGAIVTRDPAADASSGYGYAASPRSTERAHSVT